MSNPRKAKVVTVYSPSGEEEVTSWPNARDLVKNCGWSLSRPESKSEEPAKKRGRPKTKKSDDGSVEVLDASKPNYPDPNKKLERMTRTELLAHAKDEFNVELDPNRKTEYMVWTIQKLLTGLSPEEVHQKMCDEFGEDWGLPAHVGGSGDDPSKVQFVSDVRPGR